VRIHHLNCGTLCPWGGRLFDGRSPLFGAGRLVCHCLLIEAPDGLVLVDTGLGMGDVERTYPRLSHYFMAQLRPRLLAEETAVQQIRRLGYAASDVRHIVLTHLDFDHAGGLEDFPDARVHVFEDELKAALHPAGFIGRRRYRGRQWDAGVRWQPYGLAGEAWEGFEAVRDLDGVPPEILLVPLIGHTLGHCGVAVDTGNGWLLNAGDAYFYRDELKPDHRCTPGLRFYQRQMEVLRAERLHNQDRLRELARRTAGRIDIFCAHDSVEYEARCRASPREGAAMAPRRAVG